MWQATPLSAARPSRPHPPVQPGTQPFLKVNRNGERFANESSPYNDIVYAAAHQPGRVYAQICDANVLEDAKRFHTIGCSAQTRNGGEKYFQGKVDEAVAAGTLFVCDTIEELADKLGFTGEAKDTFLATVERYNELYDKQNDEDFGKPAYRLSAIRTAPFYGCWLGASLLTTEQGIAINDKGRSGQRQQADARPVCHRRYVRLLLRQQLSLPDGRRGYGPP